MKHSFERRSARALSVALALGFMLATGAQALPPAPPNDTVATAEVITTLPALIYGTTVLADNSISTTVLPSPANDVDGPDVFYSLTPSTTGTYRVQLWPWQFAPLRSSDRQFTVYVLDNTLTAIAGARSPGSARLVSFDVALTATNTYIIAVDYNATTYDNFEFTLAVDLRNLANPDNCGAVEALPSTLPVLRLNSIDGAVNDFAFTQGTGRCSVATTTPAGGNDHVYRFTAPADGDYALELVANNFDGVLYVNTTCPPTFPGGCLGASNHGSGGTTGARHELIVVTLESGVDYYVYVDNASTSTLTGVYALVIDDAFVYEINEIEPNDDTVSASPLETPLNGGQLVGITDQDYWAVPGLTGDRVYAWVNNGGSTNSTLDTDLAFYAADGTTLIEFDDEDGDGADAPINDWRFVYSTTAAVIAGARLTSDGTHYLMVTDQTATGTVHRYRFNTGVIPGDWVPQSEIAPNDTLATADISGKNYFAGACDIATDVDFYAFKANVGDRVFVAVDGDPERDSAGTLGGNDDPLAFHAKVVIYDPAGDILISDISDSNAATTPPDYPAQGGFFIARTTGTHYVAVSPQSTLSQVGPTETYELAIFIDEATPSLAETLDPAVALTPDYGTDTVAVVATDNQLGDSGIGTAALFANTNLQLLNVTFTPGDPTATFDVGLVNGALSGSAKLLVTDVAGNTNEQLVSIDVTAPVCGGQNQAGRLLTYFDGPTMAPDNTPAGVDLPIVVTDAGLVQDVNITATFETTSVSDLDLYLVSPTGTVVEVQTDRGSSSAFDIIDATWDDSAAVIMSILSGDEPYTGAWKPEGILATFNGEQAQGTWKLRVIDDSSTESGGLRLVYWQLDLTASFAGPQYFAGLATDAGGVTPGVASIVLSGATNVQLTIDPGFAPGDTSVPYTVSLIDSTQAGTGTVTVTDMQGNECQSAINLAGFVDGAAPANTGGVSTNLTVKAEVQADLPPGNPVGATSTIPVLDTFLVGEAEVDLTIDARSVGRLAATLTKGAEFASLINRVGMDERASAGLTKNTLSITLDDDAPVADDAHLEPALGTIPFIGLHQPDGRGEFVGDGIASDYRDNMLFKIANQSAFGGWKLQAADYRLISPERSTFRRWAVTMKSPCGPERYVGKATDLAPGSGIDTIALQGGAVNVALVASFTPGDQVVEYRVELVDPTQNGSGTVEITDVAGNPTLVPVVLLAQGADQNPPAISGSVNLSNAEYIGTATDNQAGDTGIQTVELAPFADNLQLVMVTPFPPAGAGSVGFTVGLVDPLQNGRGYVRVIDTCGWRSYVLVWIDAQLPKCGTTIGHTKRFVSQDLPLPIPDQGSVSSSIIVPDTDTISDVNIILNITHAFDDDCDVALTSPAGINLFNDIGSTGNDFIDTVIDDEAAGPMPDNATAAPFTDSYQPLGGPALLGLDGSSAAQTWTVQVVDDKANDTGTFDNWSVLITSATFPLRVDGRASDTELRATGICDIALLPGAINLVLTADPYDPGDKIVRYSVDLTDENVTGAGHVQVSDCAGNTCETEIQLIGLLGLGDMNCDGVIDFADINPFVLALLNPAQYAIQYPLCDANNADINNNGTPGFEDINPFVSLLLN